MNDRVKHRGTPAEPFAQAGLHGRITKTREDGALRITPASRGIPAQAYVAWGDGADAFFTWERLADLQFVGKRR
ncbi:hypothetical protein [Mycobacterium phage WXIN]|nr:hypothetical protein [Mycobacterium phage WXIN]